MATKKKSVKKKVSKKKSVKKVAAKKRTVTLYTPYVEIACKPITKKEFKQLVEVGISEEDFYELEQDLLVSNDFGSPVLDDVRTAYVEVDGKEAISSMDFVEIYNTAFAASEAKKVKPTVSKKKPETYAIIGYRHIKHGEYQVVTNKEFDPSKFSLTIDYTTDLRTHVVYGYDASYDGEDFEFVDGGYGDYSDLYILSSSGEQYAINVIEDVEESEDD